MEEISKKLEQLLTLVKAVKAIKPPTSAAQNTVGPKLPTIPSPKPPPPPSMKPSSVKAPKISSGVGPDSKKDPRKIAEQIKDGSMSTKTQKVMLKADSVTGQWYLEPTDPSSV